MITIQEFQIFQPLSLYIKWSCNLTDAQYFKIYRGINPETLVPLALTKNNYYSDISLIRERLLCDIYYKIEVYDINNNLIDEMVEHFNSTKVSNYMKYRKWFQSNFLKAVNKSAAGHMAILLQRKQSGVLCPVCGHEQTGEPQNPRCTTCWGTGFEGGFYQPMVVPLLFGNFMTRVTTYGTENHANKEFDSVVAYAYPQMYDGDYIFNKTTGERYRVSGQGSVYNRYDFNRLGTVTYTIEKLDSHHPIYQYPIEDLITSVTSATVDRTNSVVTVAGTMLRSRYGPMSLIIQDATPTISNYQIVAGTNPITLSGTFTGTVLTSVQIEIDGAATFRWSANGGTSWEEETVPIAAHTLGSTGITVSFPAGSYSIGDAWSFDLITEPDVAYQADLYADSLQNMLDDRLVFTVPAEVLLLANATYRLITNNDYYKGDILWI